LEWLERNRANLAAVLVVLATVAGVALLQIPRRPALQITSTSATPSPIKVHVVGAVQSPGVYQLDGGARAADAVKAAGGPTESADLVALNLATQLKDGQQVVVPEIASQAQQPSPMAPSQAVQPAALVRPTATTQTGMIDLNSATRQQLEALPGIGPVTAQKILDYRLQNGRFVSVQELKDAKLVNSSTYEKVKDLVEAK